MLTRMFGFSRLLLLLHVLLLAAVSVVGCKGDSTHWGLSETAAHRYLELIQKEQFAEAFDLHDSTFHPWGEPESKATFVTVLKQQAARWPGLFKYEVVRMERIGGDSRSMVFRYKVILKWEGGFPVRPDDAAETPAGPVKPVMTEEMTLNMIQRNGKWRVNRFAPFVEAIDLFGGKKTGA